MSDKWWQSAVVYQVYPRSFADSDGDGIGDLRGVIEHLDYLNELGVDVVWLSPIYASPHDDNGYDISDYRAIDPLFGTFDDFDELLEGMHARGMKLVMDLVVNHTSDEHPWFIESASSTDNPKRDWYWWRPARAGKQPGEQGAEPNNWGSFFSGPAWQLDPQTGEYYLHLFSRKQPDLNWENPEVRDAVYEMMNWWLDRGVDGFRMDVINFISKVTSLPDGVVPEGALYGDAYPYFAQGPRIHEFLHEMHERVFAGREDRYLTVGEMPGVDIEQARRFTDPRNGELDMVFQFEHVDLDHGPGGKWDHRPLSVLDLKRNLSTWQEGLADLGWNSLYWNNHDQPRVVSRFGDDGEHRIPSAKALGTVLHLMRGTPYVYQGEELGMTNVPFSSIEDFRDIESLNHYAEAVDILGAPAEEVLAALRRTSRDNARTPMQWTPGPHAGFTTGTPWITVNPNAADINAEAEVADPDSVFAHYRALIDLRHQSEVVAIGDYALVLPEHPQVFAYTRSLGDRSLLVLANLSSEPATFDAAQLPAWAVGGGDAPAAELVLSNLGSTTEATSGSLRPWEAVVYSRG
ncbi:oligo-1,6-glucosidase [Leifsonia sp. 98AMF]|uniref:glycoside hydrolase family 13 protein n=1 Tax=unclassified Leifsonia TaxID=2663824 RepID=UPI00087B604D|nr:MULTISPECIES: alpha-glucosidase [unclassified Leifsonia]SDH05611.1 oligo-1,6-glucosidase [Leifsonia sp. 197AMF]SDJ34940.1 oligo-1,6-glucosidase [Leifsonia sp. 466MF]SDK44867.1 oligo-1,6-glucosidase [Leifsonia sp. 157MF]SDN55656.1 oligo-1,6-glucosidase [Leifsonia sp. 509MF]SEN54204.1 oligo-1,6-glucosidase [Leifsonia sp. 467MF]